MVEAPLATESGAELGLNGPGLAIGAANKTNNATVLNQTEKKNLFEKANRYDQRDLYKFPEENTLKLVNTPIAQFENKDDIPRESENKALSDKPVVSNSSLRNNFYDENNKFSWFKTVDYLEKIGCYASIAANLGGGFIQLTNWPDRIKKAAENFANYVLNFSFLPYGLSGMKNGYKKKNSYQMLGFFGEIIMVWLGNLKDIYLLRGIATGTDQLWVATDPNTPNKFRDKEGKVNFPEWVDGLIHVPKICGQLIKEVFTDPFQSLAAIKYTAEKGLHFASKGHMALLSSIGSISATIGYLLTGKENIFGPLRDLSAWGLDLELFFGDKIKEKMAGLFFILESTTDFIARFLNNNHMRLFVNMLSHSAGRIALRLYKQCDSAADD